MGVESGRGADRSGLCGVKGLVWGADTHPPHTPPEGPVVCLERQQQLGLGAEGPAVPGDAPWVWLGRELGALGAFQPVLSR